MAKYNYDYETYKKRYTAKHRTYCFNLDADRDKMLIEYLEKQENMSSTIREILRKVIIG